MASARDDFQKALLKFQNRLDPNEQKDFQFTSLEDVRKLILNIQAKQRTEKRVINLNRLKRFLEGMEQFGKVIETFLNTNQFVAVVWGPVKFLLQVQSCPMAEPLPVSRSSWSKTRMLLALLLTKNAHLDRKQLDGGI
jgi:hypothetical protein